MTCLFFLAEFPTVSHASGFYEVAHLLVDIACSTPLLHQDDVEEGGKPTFNHTNQQHKVGFSIYHVFNG